ncbi:GNAT family N-acetyltransferase [Candidatus Parcubacteria bacterium]|nr:MAG: GNAT family N-acetyltransferase [Candidatus Parcubacteria bacterium]
MLDYKIEILKGVSSEDLSDISGLLYQLDSSIQKLSKGVLKKTIETRGIYVFVARNTDGKIIGTLTLVSYWYLEGYEKAWIEDVVVDKNCRGQGIGKNLIKVALEKAKKEKIKIISLTSSPTRKEANFLYIKMGFEKRDTNCYRYKFD